MRITITARHTEIDDDLRAHAKDLVEKVSKLVRRPHHAQVTFTEDAGLAGVEIEVHAPRGRIHVAKAQEADHRSALDGATARLKRQLLDEKESRRPRRARRSAPPPKVSGPR
jgi:ribosomal subunit interface protein